MGGFADMVPVGAGGCYFPVQACGPGFLLQDALCEGAAADVTQTDHQNFHGRKSTEIRVKKWGEVSGRRARGGKGRGERGKGWRGESGRGRASRARSRERAKLEAGALCRGCRGIGRYRKREL